MWSPGLAAMVGLTILLMALSVVVILVVDHYRRYRGVKRIHCPETGGWVTIQLDTSHAVCTALQGSPQLQVTHCSRWPERRSCEQECLWAAQNQLALHTVSDVGK
jgi:hypothetical protein